MIRVVYSLHKYKNATSVPTNTEHGIIPHLLTRKITINDS